MYTSSESDSNQYLQPITKSTDPDSPGAHILKRTFHNIKHEGLSENQLKVKVRRLFLEATEISCHFNSIFTKLFMSLKERNITTKDLAVCLIGLDMFPPCYESSNQPLFKDQKKLIETAEDIRHIWIIVKDYCSFFNTYIIEHVTEHLGTDSDKERMLEYKHAFKDYVKRDLSECPTVFGSMNEHDCTIVAKLGDLFDDCTANRIHILQKDLCDILKLSNGSLRLCQAKRGCYELTFQAPRIVQKMFPLLQDQESRLKDLGVIHMYPSKDDTGRRLPAGEAIL